MTGTPPVDPREEPGFYGPVTLGPAHGPPEVAPTTATQPAYDGPGFALGVPPPSTAANPAPSPGGRRPAVVPPPLPPAGFAAGAAPYAGAGAAPGLVGAAPQPAPLWNPVPRATVSESEQTIVTAKRLLRRRQTAAVIVLVAVAVAIVVVFFVSRSARATYDPGCNCTSDPWSAVMSSVLIVGGTLLSAVVGFASTEFRCRWLLGSPARGMCMTTVEVWVPRGRGGRGRHVKYMALSECGAPVGAPGPVGAGYWGGGTAPYVFKMVWGTRVFRRLPAGSVVAVHGSCAPGSLVTVVNPSDGMVTGGRVLSPRRALSVLAWGSRR